MQKTIKIKLDSANTGKLKKLDEIQSTLKLVCEDYLAFKKAQLESKDFSVTFKAKYTEYRKLHPQLNSAILQNFMRYLDEQVKSYVSWCKKKHKLAGYPEIKKIVIPLRNDCFKVKDAKAAKSFSLWLSFLHVKFPLKICKYHREILGQAAKHSDSKLLKENGEWVLALTCTMKPAAHVSSSDVLGIDIGIVHPIVCSDGKFIGNGNYIKHKKKEFGKLRAKNQSKAEEISTKQRRWLNNEYHVLSKRLIEYGLSNGKGVLCLEDLKGSELSNRKFRKFAWAFKDLLTKVNYKAELAGIKVINVPAAFTSKTCNHCGSRETDREGQSLLVCTYCGHRVNADVNAAKNIAGITSVYGVPIVNPPTGKALNLEKHSSNELG